MYLRKRALHAVLRSLVSVIDRRAEAPLDHIRLRANAGQLRATTSDGTTWLSASAPCEGDLDALLPARALLDFVSRADRDAFIEFVTDEKQVDVAFELCMSSFESRPVGDLPSAPGDEAALEWSGEAQWEAAELRKALAWVVPAMSRDVTRPGLMAVMLDKRHAVATDGHRLHVAALIGPRSAPLTIGSAAAAALLRMLGDGYVVLERSGQHLRFRGDGWQLVARVGEAPFPPYRQLVPSRRAESCHIEVDSERVVSALRTLPGPARSRPHGVQMRVNGQIVFEQQGAEGRPSRAAVQLLRSTHQGADLVIGICVQYLADAVAGGGVQTLRFGEPLAPVVVEHEDGRFAVVMPMRL